MSDPRLKCKTKSTGAITRRLFTIGEVAQYTGLSVHTLYTMVSQRRIPYVKAGRLVKFDLKAIDTWIDRHSVKPLF
jgi:excisionase family DNA binding protein